nr:KilA-N domain-containing protein [Mammaliicoccus lentus]
MLNVNGSEFSLFKIEKDDFISITDIAKYKSDYPYDVIKNWLRSKDTIEFSGI